MAKNSYTFSRIPSIKYKRSRFDLSRRIQADANVGELVPFYIEEVLPGDTFKIKSTCVSRLSSTYLKPIMDNLFIDEYFFYVPSRQLYDKFANVFGENTDSVWANTKSYSVPVFECRTDDGGIQIARRSVGDFLGLPVTDTSVSGKTYYLNRDISVLPFRAFAKIYDQWFRDENNVAPMHIQNGECFEGYPNTEPWSASNYTGMLPKVAKFHDYFTSCLPAPQKGSAVDLPVLAKLKDVPVVTKSVRGVSGTQEPLSMFTKAGNPFTGQLLSGTGLGVLGPSIGFASSTATASVGAYPSNLWAQTSTLTGQPFSVDDLRFAIQLQRMLERDARGGSRYCEYLLSHFGVSSPDLQLQRCEFLGGKRTPINISQVTQTSTPSTTADDPTGSVYGMSHSVSTSRATKGFTEHGYVIGVCCIRQFHTYTQGIPRMFTRSARTDFYDPVFATIGEQPVYKSELYGLVENEIFSPDKTVFGYQEAWVEYRQAPARAVGSMRDSLRVWNLSDNYANAPTLNQQFIEEHPDNLDNSISVRSSAQPQFILDFYVQNIAYRNLPTYSVPGLVDHN